MSFTSTGSESSPSSFNRVKYSSKLMAQKQLTNNNRDLLEPQFYPDPTLFRSSLEKTTEDDVELVQNMSSNKAMIRVLAPYLRIMRKEKRNLWQKTSSRKLKPKPSERRDTFKKSVYSSIGKRQSVFPTDMSDKIEMIVSIHDTADVLKSLLKANSVVSYMVNPSRNQLCQSPRHVDSSTSSLTWSIGMGTTIAAYAAFTRHHETSDNISVDRRFPLGLGYDSYIMKYALCVPIKTPSDTVIAVYELVRDASSVPFDTKDIQTALAITSWMGVAILQNSLYTSLATQQELSYYLLQLTNVYHSDMSEMNHTLADIGIFARETIGAERCNVFVVETQSNSLNQLLTVSEYDQGSDNSRVLYKRRTKRNVNQDGSLLGKVIIDKETINHRNENSQSDKEGELVMRSVLCVPILCNDNSLGALQLTNKITEAGFSADDTDTLQIFASFCAINLNHMRSRERETKSNLSKKVITEMLLYHIRPHGRDQNARKSVTELPEDFFTFSWYPTPDQIPKLMEYTLSLFHEVLGDSVMALNNFPKFVLTVQNCYRPNPYHNFQHAFSVCHMMCNILTRYNQIFTGVEKKGLMVAAICHDVDHRGYNNNFLLLTKHYLADLYESSPLENHHFAVTKLILQRCRMFNYIKAEIFNKLLIEIYEDIIATDLALYFSAKAELLAVVDEKRFTFKNVFHRRLVKSLMMTACDLCGQTKSLPVCKQITENIYEEFYQQGDVEKQMGFIPLPTMDRDKHDMLAENQIQFLSIVVLPCVETLCRMFTTLRPILWGTRTLLSQWKEIISFKGKDVWQPHESVPNR